MNYELAKKLKEKGFPQEITEQYDASTYSDGTYIPTLSELIENCGDRFHGIYKADTWITHIFTGDGEFDDVYVGGTTPEESVAEAWLVLNLNK